MECGVYYTNDKKRILLSKGNKWNKEIECIVKSYSSCMLSYVLFCYPYGEENKEEQAKKCINLYNDDESILDGILQEAIITGCVNLDKYYNDEIY